MTEVLTRDYANYIVNNYTQAELLARGPGYEMEPVAENILNLYADSKYEVADIIYTKFINVMQSDVVRVPLVPLTRCVQPEFLKEKSIYTFEPGLDEILPSFVPDYLNLCLRDAFIESIASEQAARMTAMENATRNAEEMVGKLRLEYNQTRQSTITRELIEIISGAEVL
jgi:F-type H+-transporting ATPase subunit gamma